MANAEQQSDPFEQQARLCRALANATRLRLLHELASGERSAGELREALGISRVLLSQHMSVLQEQRLVRVRKEGLRVFYRLSEPIIAEACDMVRQALERLAAMSDEEEEETSG